MQLAVNVVHMWALLEVPYLSVPVMINDLDHYGVPLSSFFLFLSLTCYQSFQSEVLTFQEQVSLIEE